LCSVSLFSGFNQAKLWTLNMRSPRPTNFGKLRSKNLKDTYQFHKHVPKFRLLFILGNSLKDQIVTTPAFTV
ncbi:hypothetical protein L9F63_009669, partial [Diploptera punctata]